MPPAATTEEKTASEAEDGITDMESSPNPTGGRKPRKLGQQKGGDDQALAQAPAPAEPQDISTVNSAASNNNNNGRRIVPVHESRIRDRPEKTGEKDSSLKIKIELDLEVEVEIYARVKGDVTIGLL